MSVREQFPIFEQKVYLNSCSQGALSVDVRNAYCDYLRDWDQRGSPWEYWVELMEMARRAFASLINATPDEVAVQTSVSAGVSSLMSAMDYSSSRDRIVVGDFAFPTVAQIMHAQELRGAKVIHVPAAGNVIPTERFAEAIDDRTLLVVISHVSFRNGSKRDVEAVVELAHASGAYLLLDSYQALGTMPIDVRKLNVDFLVGGVLKYLLGSAGLAYLYVREELLESLYPTSMGWFSQADIFDMDIYANTPSPTARRFESGTPPVPNIYAALVGIQFIQAIGLDEIEAHIRQITGMIKEGVMRRGFSLASPVDPDKHGALIALKSHDAALLVRCLEERNVIVSNRDDNLRISPHIYNNVEDVDYLLDCLTEYRELLV